MSSQTLIMTPDEEKAIDSQLEQMMDWAQTRRIEAEQLALDAARLMSCASDRVDRLSNQGFFKRCWNRFTGRTGEMERANTNDLIKMQKIAFRYLNMLQEQQLLMAHSLIALKNNMLSLALKEEETRTMVGLLAQRTLARFEELEHRTDQLEISTNLQGWLLSLEEREYEEKYPTEYMRLFRVINDFYSIKKDNWNFTDLMFMRKAIRTVGINPKKKISLNTFIATLIEEIQTREVGFKAYDEAVSLFQPTGMESYSKYILENISSPVFVSMHGLKLQYKDRLDIVEVLQDELNISMSDALTRLLQRSIANMNVDLDYEFPLAETAVEILGCLRLSEQLAETQETLPTVREDAIEVDSGPAETAGDGAVTSSPWEVTVDLKTQGNGNIHWDAHSRKGFLHPDNSFRNEVPDYIGQNSLVFFNNGFYRSTSDGLCFSPDLKQWNRVKSEITFGTLVSCNGLLFHLGRPEDFSKDAEKSLHYSSDGESWKPVKVDTRERRIWYEKIYFDGEKWFVFGRPQKYYDNFCSTNYIIGIGNDLSNLKEHTLGDYGSSYSYYTVIDVVLVKGYLIALVSYKEDNYLLLSKDGCSWEKFSMGDLAGKGDAICYYLDRDKEYDNIIAYGDRCFLQSSTGRVSEFFPETQQVSPASIMIPSFQRVHCFPEHGIACFYDTETLSMTRDFKTWTAIDKPDIRGTLYSTGKQLIIYDGRNKIAWCDLA